jgi:uncharacterized protein (TIGR02246 family)
MAWKLPMRLRLVGLGFAACLVAPVLSSAAVTPNDETAIQAVIDRQTDAWNQHDMAAFVADTTPDVDWINVVGMHWEGRETVLRAHEALHKGIFAHSRMVRAGKPELRETAPNVVVAVVENHIEGAGLMPSGQPYPTSGNRLTLVFVKTEAGWRIAHAHNTTIDREAAQHDPAKSP